MSDIMSTIPLVAAPALPFHRKEDGTVVLHTNSFEVQLQGLDKRYLAGIQSFMARDAENFVAPRRAAHLSIATTPYGCFSQRVVSFIQFDTGHDMLFVSSASEPNVKTAFDVTQPEVVEALKGKIDQVVRDKALLEVAEFSHYSEEDRQRILLAKHDNQCWLGQQQTWGSHTTTWWSSISQTEYDAIKATKVV